MNIQHFKEKFHKIIFNLKGRFLALTLSQQIVVVLISVAFLWMCTGIFHSDKTLTNSIHGRNEQLIYESIESNSSPKEKMLYLNGITEAAQIVDLKAETSGRVIGIPATEGDHLIKGDVIILLEPKRKQEDLQQARSEIERAQIKYKAALSLQQKGLNSQANVAAAQRDFNAAQAALKQAEIELDNTKIRAPFDGIVDKINADIGDVVDQMANFDALAKFVALSPFHILTFIPENKIQYIHKDQQAYVVLDDGRTVNGRIISVSSIANTDTKTFAVKIEIDNTELKLVSGISVYANIPIETVMAHLVPLSAITIDDNGNVIMKYIKNDKVQSSNIEIIAEEKTGIWVTNLPDKANIVVLGAHNLQTGQTIITPNGKK